MSRHTVVVGGGIAGLACAYSLRKAGASVTVLEGNRIGSGSSFGNAGWICPAQAGPLPEPGLAAHGIRSLLDADSALYFAPAQLPRMAGWLAQFARRCNERDHRRGLEALATLGPRTFAVFEELEADGVEFELHRLGMVFAARETETVRAFVQKLEPMRRLGYGIPQEPLDADAVHELEPGLSSAVTAGVEIGEHWHVRPDTLCHGLAAALVRDGVEIEEGAEVVDFERDGSVVTAVRTVLGLHQAEAVVLAAGAWTPHLCRMLGSRLPIEAGKGYSFSVIPSVMPRHALLLGELHLGCSPLGNGLRIAGTMEFSGVNLRLDRRRIDAMVRGARSMLEPFDGDGRLDAWVGMRPIAPDGLPVIDRLAPYRNVCIATGYSMLGMTLAGPAGNLLAELVVDGRRPAGLEPFSIARFSRVAGDLDTAPPPRVKTDAAH